MPKSKKRKTNHNQSNNGELTHEEIWDDSALIRSWNDAVAEYQFYHSIHAKGEDVEEVLRKHEAEEQQQLQHQNQQPTASLPVPKERVDIEDGEIEDQPITTTTTTTTTTADIISSDTILPTDPPEDASTRHDPEPSEPEPAPAPVPPTTKATAIDQPTQPTLPTQTQSHTQAQTLENIKMAYYWAGYYSGLHDGQGQTTTQTQTQPQP